MRARSKLCAIALALGTSKMVNGILSSAAARRTSGSSSGPPPQRMIADTLREHIEAILRILQHPTYNAQRNAHAVLRELPVEVLPEYVSAILPMLHHSHSNVRVQALWVLAELKPLLNLLREHVVAILPLL